MTEPKRSRPDVQPPTLATPAPFVERRASPRRGSDRLARRETALLARSLDVLAAGGEAEDRLAGILRVLSATVEARRTAVLGDFGDRRVVVERGAPVPGAAERLAGWLDAVAPRTRAARAASGRAHLAVVGNDVEPGSPPEPAGEGPGGAPAGEDGSSASFACLPIPDAGDVVLGFEFDGPVDAEELADRLPPQLARHAAVALALVTRQLTLERELDLLRAREAEQARFVSIVAHELRTPLTGLSGYLDLILEGKVEDPAVARDFLERSQGIAGSMNELVGDLLELSRLESGAVRLEIGPFSVAEVGTRVIEALEPVAMRRGICLSTSLPSRLRAANGDRRRVEQILTNLVGNALKFGAAGSEVEVRGWFDGAVALFAVRDEGSGIAPDDRARIFERFYRVGGQERVTGTGLGLAIARDLAHGMGGDLDVASVPGSGSSFVLALAGPAPVEPDVVRAALERALAAEEVRLEEAAVLRALKAAGRALPRPHLVRSSADPPSAPPGGHDGRPGPPGPVRLRALDDTGTPTTDRSPA